MTAENRPSFGYELRRLRHAAGLSQEELGERAGLTAAAVGALERGERRHPYPHTLQVLADALNLSPAGRTALFMTVPRRGAAHPAPRSHQPPPESARWPKPPAALTPLVGRGRELALITGLFKHGRARLVTLTGPGGAGKTRLAAEVARALEGSFDAGAVWVDLVPVQNPELVMLTIARALGLGETAGQTAAGVLESYLSHRQLLMVLDNVEHLLVGVLAVPALLERCPGLSILMTSREVLHVRGEHEVQIPPLELPETVPEAGAALVAQSEAVELFLQRVRAVHPDFELTDENAREIAALCIQMDGLPLALEIAAAQLRYVSLAVLLARTRDRLALLESRFRDLPARQQSLRATLDWSHSLLSAPEQRLFRRLCVFAGGFSREAALAVCNVEGDSDEEVISSLLGLVDKSMVRSLPDAGGEGRFAILQTIREYARERLIEQGEERLLANRHAGYYCDLAETAEPNLTSPSQQVWMQRLDLEADNLRAALEWTTTRGDLCLGLRLYGALGWFWFLHGHVQEFAHWSGLLLDQPFASCAPRVRAGALYVAAVNAWKWENLAAAREFAREAIALRRAHGDSRRLAFSLAIAGSIETSGGDLDQAARLHEESLCLFRDLEDSWGIALALSNLGDTLLKKGDLASATSCYTESLEYFTAIDDPWGRGIVHYTLGKAAWERGDLDAARCFYRNSIDIFNSINNRELMARALIGLAAATLAAGDIDAARCLLIESLEVWRDLGSQAGKALCLAGLAAVETARGQFPAAAEMFGTVEAQCEGRPTLYVIDAGIFAPYQQKAREQLGEAEFTRAWTRGQRLPLDEAIQHTLARESRP